MAALLLGLVGVVAANGAGVRDSASERWNEFRSGEGVAASGPSRFTATGDPTRYDYWRVALDAFADHPLAGVGAGNYEPRYAARRDHPKYSRYAHSLPLNVLAETGVVGFLLLFGAIGCAVAAVLSRRSGLSASGRADRGRVSCGDRLPARPRERGLGGAGPRGGDPGVGIPVRGRQARRTRARPGVPDLAVSSRCGRPGRRGGPVTHAGVPVVALRRARGRALDHRARQGVRRPRASAGPESALDGSAAAGGAAGHRAAGLLPRTLRPARCRQHSDSWYAHFELALVEAHQGRLARRAAHRSSARAELNGREPFVRRTRAAILRGVSPDPRRTNRALRRATSAQFR